MTESGRNTFTRPPVWEGERVLVWLGIVERRVSPHGWLEKSPASCVQAIKEPPPYAASHFEDLVRASLVALSRQQLSRARAGIQRSGSNEDGDRRCPTSHQWRRVEEALSSKWLDPGRLGRASTIFRRVWPTIAAPTQSGFIVFIRTFARTRKVF